MITLEESLALIQAKQEQNRKQSTPRTPLTEAEASLLEQLPELFDPKEVAQMEAAIHEAFPINTVNHE
jgi:hypothetical protein